MNVNGNFGKENLSPIRTTKPSGSNVMSPFGLLASPLSNIELMSPESTLSFSLSSPPPSTAMKVSGSHTAKDLMNANISPSIFSPEDHHLPLRFLHREKEGQFPTLYALDSARLPLFPKEVQLDKKVQKKSLRVKKKGEDITDESDGMDVVPNKSRKSSGKKSPNSSVLEKILSPNNDIARRLSLESNSELVTRSVKILPDSATKAVIKNTPTLLLASKSTPVKTSCNCKKSKCLKLYCDCFAVLKYCDSAYCNCTQCFNNADNEAQRNEAIKATKEKNTLAFQTKISDKDQHVTGCHCKNSHCLKKYCECFTGGALCGVNCKCQSCQNYEGSTELMKAREASPKSESSGKKRKESPNGVEWINEESPHLKIRPSLQEERKTTPYSFRSRTKETQKKIDPQPVMPTVKAVATSSTKRRKVKFATTPYVYPFFGEIQTPKLIALKCLDFLDNKDIYRMSQLNNMWNQVAMDEALWE